MALLGKKKAAAAADSSLFEAPKVTEHLDRDLNDPRNRPETPVSISVEEAKKLADEGKL